MTVKIRCTGADKCGNSECRHAQLHWPHGNVCAYKTDCLGIKDVYCCNHCMSEFYEDCIDIDAISADSGETCPVCGKGDALMDVDSPEKRDAAIRKECAEIADDAGLALGLSRSQRQVLVAFIERGKE